MKWWPKEPEKGDMIRVRIGSVYHYGIFSDFSEVIQFGEPPVSFNRKTDDLKVFSSDIDFFSAGQIVEVASFDAKEKRKKKSPDEIVTAARSRIGEGDYDILTNNCEHFAMSCVFGEKKSDQSDRMMALKMKKPFLHIYLYPYDESLPVKKLKTAKRNTEILFTGNKNVKREKYAAFDVLEAAYEKETMQMVSFDTFKKESTGKWNTDLLSFSISHTKKMVAIVLSNETCGIDIEDVQLASEKFTDHIDLMIEKALSIEEQSVLLQKEPDEKLETFLCYWTGKESIFKTKNEKAMKPKEIHVSDADTRFFDVSFHDNEYMLAVTGNKEDFSIFLYDGKQFTEISTSEAIKELRL